MKINKIQILDTLAWIFLAIGIILLLWYIFGNSPNELYISLPFTFFLMTKIWSISENQIKLSFNLKPLSQHYRSLSQDHTTFKESVKNSFTNIKKDISNLKTKQ